MSIIQKGQMLDGDVGFVAERPGGRTFRPAYGPTLVLALILIAGLFLLIAAGLLLVVHPGSSLLDTAIIRQKQSAKTILYLGAFAVMVPVAVVAALRLAPRLAAGPNGPAIPGLVYGLAGLLAAELVLVKLLPISGHGLRAVLAAVGLWWIVAAGALIRAGRSRPWPAIQRLANATPSLAGLAAIGVFGVVLCVTALSSLSVTALAIGAAVALFLVWASGRMSLPSPGRFSVPLDIATCLVILLAVVNVVIYHSSRSLPNAYFPPGVIQFQQDWMLSPANQLLAGGALLVNVPSSQYGVGMVYFLAVWFHVAPISYATFGLLDGILTALVYICGYAILRIAGISRMLAAAALALAISVFVYHLQYPVGALPEQGPLRFGLPMAVIAATAVGFRWTRSASVSRAATLFVVAVSSIWALENFAYTIFTYLAMVAVAAVLRPAGRRARYVLVQSSLALAVCIAAHLILAGATLAATGQLPDWSQYLAHVNTLLLGGPQGIVTYGFADWSPGLALGAACLGSAAGLVLLILLKPRLAQANRTPLVAIAGLTAYAIASFSYSDNRSSTYLLPYVSLPVLLSAVLWLRLFLSAGRVPITQRRFGLSLVLAVAVLMFAAAWSTIGTDFSQSALAHAYPGGGLRAALHRLWHPPPVDPRAPALARMIRRSLPGRRVLVLLPTRTELALEALMRAGKANALFLGDPAEDIWVPSVWVPKIRDEIAAMKPGGAAIVDQTALAATAQLAGRSGGYVLSHPVDNGNAEIEWILHALSQRFRLAPVAGGPYGLRVVRLRTRSVGR